MIKHPNLTKTDIIFLLFVGGVNACLWMLWLIGIDWKIRLLLSILGGILSFHLIFISMKDEYRVNRRN